MDEYTIKRLAKEQQAEPAQFLNLAALAGPPKPLKDGMVCYADGTNWNPGSGAGVYLYRAGAWRFLG